jgi:hypothetical protein
MTESFGFAENVRRCALSTLVLLATIFGWNTFARAEDGGKGIVRVMI